jgi:hypothetical protein
MTSPTQRSIELLKKEGYKVAIVEKFNHFIKIRQDLFGFIDLVALHPDKKGILGVQTTSGSHLANRIDKAMMLPAFHLWIKCGNAVEFHGWVKKGARGKRKLWSLNRHSFPTRV